MTYIANNYVTLILLAALSVMLITNRKMKIEKVSYLWLIMGIDLLITICEAAEDMCELYGWSVRMLYFKSAFVYCLYPLMAVLMLYLVVPVKRKLLMAIPYLVNTTVVFIDLFGTGYIYRFSSDHRFYGGRFILLPQVVLGFYVVMLVIYSIIFISGKSRSKGVIVLFIAVISVITSIGEIEAYFSGHSETIATIEIMVYYLYLSSVDHVQTQKNLYESRIALEQDNIKLLVAQIQLHFIFNTLAEIQSLCYTDSDKAVDCIDVFGEYLRANIDSLSSEKPISFKAELEHIEQFVQLEKASIDYDFKVEYELHTVNFSIPPLTVQPIVENTVKHEARTRRDGTSVVTIKTEQTNTHIIIIVTDNGKGATLTDKQKEHQSVGIENIRQRLKVQCNGSIDVNIRQGGCTAVITLPIR